ncbi:exosome complex component RRP41 homolog [Cyclospora cayetanensis]|uniref:Exosome complex component RRP41 homolog n=1 Tax=Cyclospora cayetanensis TaxID=88456 RepID=A0A6P6RR92_9EIME|nr:exosome complex component RRP41 homolog [Cyclospora cayetanensis]
MYKAEAVNPCGFRADGRLVHECRQLRCRTSVPLAATTPLAAAAAAASPEGAVLATVGGSGCLTSCDGRAVVSLGCTKVMALVYGPQPASSSSNSGSSISSSSSWSVSSSDTTTLALQMLQEGRQGQARGDLNAPLSVVCSVGFVDSCIRLRCMYTPDTAEVAAAVRAAAEGIILRRLYTQTKITISILVLADDGSILSASLIAASLALADAGVAMRDLLPACTVLLLPQHQPQHQQQQQQHQPVLLLDPTNDEARTGGPSLTLGVTAQTNSIVALQLSGKVDKETFDKMFEMCLRGCFAAAECMKVGRLCLGQTRNCRSLKVVMCHQQASSRACPRETFHLIMI